MKFKLRIVVVLVVLGWSNLAYSTNKPAGVLTGIHGNTRNMPKTCRACHRGMNMKISGEERVCLTCHGDSQQRQVMVANGYLAAGGDYTLENIEQVLRKPYNHPVLTTSGVHQQMEALPEEMVNAKRHAECVDCHHPHQVTAEAPFLGIGGRRVGNFMADIEKEYELCYRCHAESANLPAGATNKHAEFKTTNPSFHPVEGEGRNSFVISLMEPYAPRKEKPGDIAVISCSDCHGNDDSGGPKGPHGSNFRGLLIANYDLVDGRRETEVSYALCYKCHSRASILGNESFPYHALHIQGNEASGQPGTSCDSCHDAHGSTRYPYLLLFNEDTVRSNADNKLEFSAQGVASRHGSCLLNCHGVEHNPKNY